MHRIPLRFGTAACAVSGLTLSLVGCGSDNAATASNSTPPSATPTAAYPSAPPDQEPISDSVVGGAELLPRLSIDQTYSAGDLPNRIRAYHDSGIWNRDIANINTSANVFLRKQVDTRCGSESEAGSSRCPLATTFDIDDTLVSSYGFYAQPDVNFVYSKALVDYEQSCRQPAIASTQALFKYAQSIGVRVVILSGRSEEHRAGTEKCLRQAGYTGKWEMILRQPSEQQWGAIKYKTAARKRLADQGTPVVINVGDQLTDLEGGGAARGFLIPNPMYRLK